MINANIQAAAQLIAEIDPALSRAFLSQPFNRHTLVTAFHKSLSNSFYAPMADRISSFCRSAIDSTKLESAE